MQRKDQRMSGSELLTLSMLHRATNDHKFWGSFFDRLNTEGQIEPHIHVGIFREPYLNLILLGQKTLESRFSQSRQPPYKTVQNGDILLLKDVSGPIKGIALIADVESRRIFPSDIEGIRKEYSGALCVSDDQFWESKMLSNFLTLMSLEHPHSITPINYKKRDQRGWVSINQTQFTLNV